MADHERFSLKSVEELEQRLKDLGLSLPISNDFSILNQRVKLGSRTLANRFVAQPMEGVDANELTGGPSELTLRRYKRFAAGGSALIWFEAVVVSPDGKSNPRQLTLTRENLDAWKQIVEATRKEAFEKNGHEVVLVIQLTHSGRWSKPQGTPKPVLIHRNPKLDPPAGVTKDTPLATDEELEKLKADFVNTALLAYEAGFDGVETKAVHGYFTGEMLCAHTRPGKFGGSYENRTRFVREATLETKNRMPADRFVTARLTMYEPSPFPYGWGTKQVDGSLELDLSEPLRFAKELATEANMPVFNFSIGYPRFEPYMNRPFDNPLAGSEKPKEHPLEGIVRFQNISKALQERLGEVPVATAALGWLRELGPYVMAGLVKENYAKLIGQGRQTFAYPDSVNDILNKGAMDPKKTCITCSLCSQIMKDVVGRNGCPIRDKEIYSLELKKGRNRAKELGLP